MVSFPYYSCTKVLYRKIFIIIYIDNEKNIRIELKLRCKELQKKIDEKLSDDDNTSHEGTEKENKNNNKRS
jgi:hypothetical protein